MTRNNIGAREHQLETRSKGEQDWVFRITSNSAAHLDSVGRRWVHGGLIEEYRVSPYPPDGVKSHPNLDEEHDQFFI